METLQRNRRILAAMTVLAIVTMSILAMHLCKVVSCDKMRSAWPSFSAKKYITDRNNPDIPGDFPLHKAVRLGLMERVNTLIANGADINARDNIGQRTPLHYAVEYFHRDMMRLLVEKGADVNVRDSHGYTPLHYAGKGQKDMAEYLRKNGAQE